MTNEDESVMHAIRSLELQAEMRGVAKGRAEGAAAERARLVAVVAEVRRKGIRAPVPETDWGKGYVTACQNVLEAMVAAEGSAGE